MNKYGFIETKDGNMFWFVLGNPKMTEDLEWHDFIQKRFIDLERVFYFKRGHWDSGGDFDEMSIPSENIKRWWTEEL